MEVQHRQPKVVRHRRGLEVVPPFARVRRVVARLRVRDEVCAVGREGVVVERDERLLGVEPVPGVPLVGRLPDAVVCEPDEDDRRVTIVGVLNDRARELEVRGGLADGE